jgi:hypothetical protein
MTDSFRTTPADQQWSSSNTSGNGYQGAFGKEPQPAEDADGNEMGKTLLIGVLGGLVSAAGYMVYRRLPDEQKERLHSQVRTLVSERVSEIRKNFNI